MSTGPIVMENEGHERTEYCPRWHWENGSVSYGPPCSTPALVQAFLDKPPTGVTHGVMVGRAITTTRWEPVLPVGVLRLDELRGCEEYGGVRVAELGEGVVEGYTVVALTDDPARAFAAVRAHFVMVHNEMPDLALRWESDPVRWWQVYGTCGCGETCTHIDGEDHGCARWGLPPCRAQDEDGAAWIGELCEKDAPGAVPFVEIEVGSTRARDERVDELTGLLAEARQKTRALIRACLSVKKTLDEPYSGMSDSTPWERFVERPAKDADQLAVEIGEALRWKTFPAVTS